MLEILVEDAPLALLKLKAEIQRRIGVSAKSLSATTLTFPAAWLPTVADLLSPSVSNSASVSRALREFADHGRAREKALERLAIGSLEDVPTQWVERLDLKQAAAVSAMVTPGLMGACLFDEQGTGKTVMSIAVFDILNTAGIIDAAIVVCPKSMVTEWPGEFGKFAPMRRVRVAEGSTKQNIDVAASGFDVLVLNYEKIALLLPTLRALAQRRKFLLVIDESYYVKNEDALRSEALAALRDTCCDCLVLCGTPAPNSPYDLINQFNLADAGFTFGTFRPSGNEDSDIAEIESRLDQRGTFIRRLKAEVLPSLPDKQFRVLRVKMTGKQAARYESARRSLYMELKGLDNLTFRRNLTTYFQKRAVLLQLCSSPSVVDPTIVTPSAKILALDSLLVELVENGRKVVLWSFFTASIEEIFHRYIKYNPVRIDGSVSGSARSNAIRAFQEDPTVMLFVANPAAAGAGITLHASHDAIYYSYSNQAAHYLQSLDRIHRRGQVHDVTYHLLVCEGTIEETEVMRLRKKELAQHSLLGDRISFPSSIDDALAELSDGIQRV